MNRTFVAVCGAVIMSAALVGAQSNSADTNNKNGANAASSTNTVTFTGCLSPGSKGETFYLTSAKQKGVKNAAKTVKLVPATKKVDLNTFVTQEVEVTGTIDQAGSAPAAGSDSAQAPTLTVTKVKSRTDAC